MKGLVLDAKWDPRPGYQVSEWEKQTGKAITGNGIWRHPTLQVTDWPDPTPGPQDVVLEVMACGVCGSDMHFYETDKDGYILYPGLTKFPTILGHEFSGRVIATGPQVSSLKMGDMVTVEEMIWCGRCVNCRNGFPNQCTNLEEIGFTIPGAFANYIAVDEKFCWKIDAIAERLGNVEEAFELGAMTEPTTVAYNGMIERAGGFRPGQYVAVFGAGAIGLAATGIARAAGAGKVVVFEMTAERRELAKLVGADAVYSPADVTPSEVLMELSDGAGFDFFVEAAGAPVHTIPEMERRWPSTAASCRSAGLHSACPCTWRRSRCDMARCLVRRGTRATQRFPMSSAWWPRAASTCAPSSPGAMRSIRRWMPLLRQPSALMASCWSSPTKG